MAPMQKTMRGVEVATTIMPAGPRGNFQKLAQCQDMQRSISRAKNGFSVSGGVQSLGSYMAP